MTYRLIDGDYALDGNGGIATVSGREALLQNAVQALTARRGRFYPNKEFGSRIREELQEPENAYALAFAQQALDAMHGVFVTKAEKNGNRIIFRLFLNNREEEVAICFEDDL